MRRVIFIFAILLSTNIYASSSYNRAVKQYQSKDYSDALKSFYVSARHHNLNAYYMLGKMHEEGIGTAINYQTAFYWYQKSAKRGHPTAQYRLARMYESGTGVVVKPKKAKAWYERAASNGNKDAKKRLANWDKKVKIEKPKQTHQNSHLETILPSAIDNKKEKIEPTKELSVASTKEDDNSSIVDMLMFWK